MRQFQIRRLRSGDLVVILQHETLDGLNSCIVAPLAKPSRLLPISRLRPMIDAEGSSYVLVIDHLAAIDRTRLGPTIGDAADRQDEINLALDLVFKGF